MCVRAQGINLFISVRTISSEPLFHTRNCEIGAYGVTHQFDEHRRSGVKRHQPHAAHYTQTSMMLTVLTADVCIPVAKDIIKRAYKHTLMSLQR